MHFIWKDIDGWEEYYEVNNFGKVRNKITKHLIVGDKNSEGYSRVCLYNKNHNPPKQRFFRHRLVAKHFIPNPNNLPEVNHIDTNLEHCYESNLEWVTKKDNELHSRKYGAKEYKPFKVTYNDNSFKFFNVKEDLANELNLTRACIKHWLHKKNNGFEKYNIKSIEYI